MSGVASLVLLAAGVLLVWVCVLGMLRARDAFARLHFPGAAVMVGPPAAAGAILLAEGLSPTAIRGCLIFVVLLLMNGIIAHATARAEWLRRGGEDDGRGPCDEDP